MIYLGIAMVVLLVILVVLNGLLIWASLSILKVEGATFWKSITILAINLLISFAGMLVFYLLNLMVIWGILSLFVGLIVLTILFKKYFDLSWLKSVLVYVLYSVFQTVAGMIIVLVMILPLRTYILGWYIIDGNSMSPTVENGEMLIVDKWTKDFQRGDMVVYKDLIENSDVVKRIVGLPGEQVEIRDGGVWINNQILKEDYINVITGGSMKTKLGNDEYFVLGDNRSDSRDSREIGAIHRDQIVGEYLYKYNTK